MYEDDAEKPRPSLLQSTIVLCDILVPCFRAYLMRVREKAPPVNIMVLFSATIVRSQWIHLEL